MADRCIMNVLLDVPPVGNPQFFGQGNLLVQIKDGGTDRLVQMSSDLTSILNDVPITGTPSFFNSKRGDTRTFLHDGKIYCRRDAANTHDQWYSIDIATGAYLSTVALPQFPINGDGDVFDENEYIHYVSNITNNIYKVKKSDFSIADSVDVGQILSADIQLDAAIQYVPLWDNMGILCSNGFTDVIIYEYDYTTGLTGRSINLHTAFGSMGWNLTDDRHYSVTAEGQFIYVSNPNPAIADTTVSASSARVNKTLNTMAGEIGVDLGSFDIWGSFSDGIDWYAVNAAAKYDSQLGPHVCKFDKDINLVASHDGAINGVLASTYGLICKLWT